VHATRPEAPAVYLDVCCLNRLSDDQSQMRIRLEAIAVAAILARMQRSELRWISSEVVDFEIGRTVDPIRRARVRLLASDADVVVSVDEQIRRRAEELEDVGIGAADALHVACAERGSADVFLTVDDTLL